jgi:hypothetical protein
MAPKNPSPTRYTGRYIPLHRELKDLERGKSIVDLLADGGEGERSKIKGRGLEGFSQQSYYRRERRFLKSKNIDHY